jgi:hypothetical protein
MCICIYVHTDVCLCIYACMYVCSMHVHICMYITPHNTPAEKKNPAERKKKNRKTPQRAHRHCTHTTTCTRACTHSLHQSAYTTLTLTHTHHAHMHPSLPPLALPHLGCFASVARCHTKFWHSFSARNRRLHCCPPALAPMRLARYWGSPGSCWTCWTTCPGVGMGNFGLLMRKFWLLLWNF